MLKDSERGGPTIPDPDMLPHHVAVIMDGNGRWATDRGLPRLEGHRQGANVVRDITTFCCEIGIGYLTLYSFSVQNWQRPPDEVAGLMSLLEDFCRDEKETLMKNRVRLTTIGRLDRLPDLTREAVLRLCEETNGNDGMLLTLALDYGGREELVCAFQELAFEIERGELSANSVDASLLRERLTTSEIPDPDLVLRTSGELRVSNFLLWQIAYAEFVFLETYWPDLTRQDFAAAIEEYTTRQRRFGGLESRSPNEPLDDLDPGPDERN